MELCINELSISQNGDLISHIEACAAHGIHAIEIYKGCLMAYLRSGHTLEELRGLLKKYAITPVCLNSIESISFNPKRGMRVLLEMSEYLFYCCREIGCNTVEVIGSFQVPTELEKEIHDQTVTALCQLADIARPYGVRLALEYMGVPSSSVKTFSQALDVVRSASRDNVGLLVDTWHHYASGSSPEELLKADDEVFMVHISDCPKCAPLEALRSESYMPGSGVIPIAEMLGHLQYVGYHGPVSVEVMAPEIRALPATEYIALAKDSTIALL